MNDYNRRELLGLSVAGVAAMTEAAGPARSLVAREEAKDGDSTPSIKTRMFWTWDHSTEWALNRPGAQTMGAMNPYFRSADVFVEDYTRLLEWSGKHHIDAVVVWGLLRDSHGGVEAAKKLCDVAAKNGVRLLAGVGLCAYGGVYYEGGSRQSMRVHLQQHPELRASAAGGRPILANMMACPSRQENRDYIAESLLWLFKTLPSLGGVQMETGDTGTCLCKLCKERRKYPAGSLSWEDMALMYPIATDAIRSVKRDALIVCETYTNPEPHRNPKIQGGFGEGKPPWGDECIATFPKDVYVQWVCDEYVKPKARLAWTEAGRVATAGRRNIMRAHFGTYWTGRRGELAVDWIADMVQKSMQANCDAVSLFGEVSPFHAGAELNYLALETYGSSANPKADLTIFLQDTAAPLLGGKDAADTFFRCARSIAQPGSIPAVLKEVYAQCGKQPGDIARRWAWLGNYLGSFIY
jgi:hypothetical protein